MGTRAVFSFKKSNYYNKIYIYNHWDNYPGGAAAKIYNAINYYANSYCIVSKFFNANKTSEITIDQNAHSDIEWYYEITNDSDCETVCFLKWKIRVWEISSDISYRDNEEIELPNIYRFKGAMWEFLNHELVDAVHSQIFNHSSERSSDHYEYKKVTFNNNEHIINKEIALNRLEDLKNYKHDKHKDKWILSEMDCLLEAFPTIKHPEIESILSKD